MTNVKEDVKKVFVYNTVAEWDITESEEEARQIDPTYKLADIADLHMLVALCGHIFEGKIMTADGVVEWHEEYFPDELSGIDDYYVESEYRLVS